MDPELRFRIAVIVLLVSMKFARWPTRRLSGWRASWPAMKNNPADTVVLFSCSLVWLAVLIAYLGFPERVAWAKLGLPDWIRWAAVATAVAPLGLMGWADRALGNNFSITLQIKEDHMLVTSGPYARVRHPLYSAALLFLTAVSLVSDNWLLGVCFVGGMGAICATRIPKEEQMMIGRFGDRYRRYMQRTGRLLPPFGRSGD